MVKRNHFLVYSATAAAVISGLIYWASLAKSSQGSEPGTDDLPVVVQTSNSSIATLGAIGDTPEDTLRTLTASLTQDQENKKQMEIDLERTKTELKEQKSENTAQIEAMNDRFNQQLAQIEKKLTSNYSDLKARQQDIGVVAPDLEQLGISSGRENESDDWSPQGSQPSVPSSELVWTEPMDAKKDDNGQWITPLMQGAAALKAQISEMGEPFDARASQGTPVYTLHRGSVLSNATALTALMGRIPVNGQVTSPYPFSMVIGAKNLLANGFTLPEVQGAIVTGTVTGD